MIRAHLFDLDGTLIAADTDVSWQSFLVARGLAPRSVIAEADRFYEQYRRGTLIPEEFLRFQFRAVLGRPLAELRELAREHFTDALRALLLPRAAARVAELKREGLPVAVLTSTFVELARPAAEAQGIREVLGTTLKVDAQGNLTSELAGPYGLGPGKVAIAEVWRRERGLDWSELAYYGDSINDRFILERVGAPFAVNATPELVELAAQRGWPLLDWR